MKKRILSLLLVLVMVVGLLPTAALAADTETPTPTSGACGDNATWTYDAASKTLTISGTGATYDYGSTIAKAPPYADSEIYPIEHFVVEEGITTLGKYTIFSYIKSGSTTKANTTLTDIHLPDSLTELATYAIYKNAALKSITFPKNVTSFNTTGFTISGCTELEEIKFDGDVTEIGQVYRGLAKLKSATIPANATSICDSAFNGCKALTNLTIPSTVTTIGSKAFYSCTGLTALEIPASVTSIGDNAFYSCTGLTTLEIPATVTSIGSSTFSGCSGLTAFEIPTSVTSIGSSAFAKCTGITRLEIPVSVTSIGSKAFDGWTADQTVHFNLKPSEAKAKITFANDWKSGSNAKFEYLPMDAAYCDGVTVTLKDGEKSYPGTMDMNEFSLSFSDEVDIMRAPSFNAPEIVITKDGQSWTSGTATLTGALSFTDAGNGLYTTNTKLTLAPAEGTEGDAITLSISFRVTEKAFEGFQGSGTEEDPYIIDNAVALYQLSKQVNSVNQYSKGKCFRQTADIDMTGVDWKPIGITSNRGVPDNSKSFMGSYDGGNFRIKNLTVDNTDSTNYGVGLFGSVKDGTICNVIMDKSCSFRAAGYVGGIVGAANTATIEHCVNEANVYAAGSVKGNYGSHAYAGGIVGHAYYKVNILNCENYGAISGDANTPQVGGIAGSEPASVINCHNYGSIFGGRCVGGVTGSLSNSVMIGCSNHGSVSSSYEASSMAASLDQAVGSTGGLSGWIMPGSVVESCYNTGTVSVDWPGAGGLFGAVSSDIYDPITIANCYTTGKVQSTYSGEWDTAAGAVFGYIKPNKASRTFANLFYLEQGMAAIGANDAPDTFTLPEARTTDVMKSDAFLQVLQSYSTLELTAAVWTADTENQNNGYPVLNGTTERLDYHKQLTKFTVGSLEMTIDEAAGTVTGMVSNDADLTALAPTLTISANATVAPASGEAVDFSKGAVEYTVTAQDGTTKIYTVTLTKPESAKGLMAFQLQGDYSGTDLTQKLLLPASDFDQNTLTYTIDCRDGVIGTQLNAWAIPALANSTMTVAINGGDPAALRAVESLSGSGMFVRCFDVLHQGKNTLVFTVTPPAGSEGETVTYTVNLNIRPSLHDMKVTGTGVKVSPSSYQKSQSITDYTLTMDPSAQTVNVSFTAYGEPDSTVVTGLQGLTNALKNAARKQYQYTAAVPVTQDMDKFTITVSCADETIPATTYTFHLVWENGYSAKIETNVSTAQVRLTNPNGELQIPGENGAYALTNGQTYTYIATAKGYKSQTGTITGPESLTDGKLVLTLEAVAPSTLKKLDALWPSFRGNDQHMAITASETARTANEAELLWSTAAGEGYDTGAVSSPIIVDGYLYAYAGEKLLKIDMEKGNVTASGTMAGTSDFAIVPPTYAEGMIFVGLSKGRVQAFNAETLESLWVYSDPLKGQSNSPIVYHDGCVYTGFWNGETKTANFVCLSIDDEDPNAQTEAKQALWTYTQAGGFYWAGAYASGDYIIVGTDDGKSGYTSSTASLLVFDKDTGALADSKTGYTGDIRSNVSYDAESDRVYFTSKGGYFYSEKIDWTTGQIDTNESKAIDLGGMSTSTPVVYKGRAYVGVSGTSQFGPYSGHHIAVLDLTNWNVAYTATTQGYPQTSGMLTTAYEKDDGYVYVYFMDNYTPGVMRVIQDKAGQTALLGGVTESGHENCAPVVFTPEGKLAQYCICSPVADENGTIYFKNDTGYLMAIGNKTVSAAAVAAVEEKINAIGTVTLESEDAIKAAREAYDALTDAQKEKVTNYQTLLDAESALVELKADYAAAAAVDALIDKIGTVTLDSEADIAAARTAYDALTEKQKGYVTKLDVLTAAETELQNLKDAAAAKRVEDQINALPDTLTLDDKAAVDAAKAAYDALTEKQRGYISDSAKQKLNAALAEIKRLEDDKAAAEAVERLINAIGDVTLESEDAIKAAREAYDALTDAQKAFVSNYDVLVAAEARYAQLVDEAAAEHVIDLINGIGKVNKNSGTAIKAARDAYDALTPAQKKLVSNYQTLLDAEKRYEELTTPVNPVGPSKPSKPATPDTGKNLPFTDVAKRDWYYDGVKYAYDNGLMNGTGANAFSPNADTTRGMIVTILARLEGVNTSGGAVWYEAGREWAMKNGISDGTNMEGKITREQLAAMLYRYAKLKGYDVSASASLSGYTDASSVSGWAKEAMQWAVGSGLIQGSGNALTPQANASRAQIATILMRFAEKIAK